LFSFGGGTKVYSKIEKIYIYFNATAETDFITFDVQDKFEGPPFFVAGATGTFSRVF